MVAYLVSMGMFLLGYVLGTWTFCRASRQQYVLLPGAQGPKYDPEVIQRSEADEALLENLRSDKAVRSLDGIGRF